MKALEGVLVLDLSRLLPGPFCSLLLAELGAEVIKVEEPGTGDYTRWMPPQVGETGAIFAALNRGKKSVGIDLKSGRGRELLLRLAERCDVLLESFRPGVAERLGIGYEAVRQRAPQVVYCAITGYGQSGPYSGRAGHDANYLAYAGALGLTGVAGGAPVLPAIQIADIAGGAYPAAVGILAALLGRRQTGQGTFVDISMTEGALALLGPLYAALAAGEPEPERGRLPLTGRYPCYRIYPTADGQSLAVGALEPKFFERLCLALGRPDLADKGLAEGEEGEKAAAELEQIFRQQSRDDWMAWLEAADACVAPVLRPQEVPADPQMQAREAFMEVPLGPQPAPSLRMPRSPVRLVPGTQAPAAPPPGLGQHTDEVLGALGLSATELDELRTSGVIV
jgi:crotonobetainyl-CoA:carnitine CoA-transferase CaiB-like acyl-CoA transferase